MDGFWMSEYHSCTRASIEPNVLPISTPFTVHSTRLHVVSWQNSNLGPIGTTSRLCQCSNYPPGIPFLSRTCRIKAQPFYDCQYPFINQKNSNSNEKSLALFGIRTRDLFLGFKSAILPTEPYKSLVLQIALVLKWSLY
jgi:hypothetical protein